MMNQTAKTSPCPSASAPDTSDKSYSHSPRSGFAPLLLKRKEAAALLGVSQMHISNLVDCGQLRAINLATPGKRYRSLHIPLSELKRFLSDRLGEL